LEDTTERKIPDSTRRTTFKGMMFSLRAAIASGGLVRSVLEIGNSQLWAPTGAERASVVLLKAAPLRGKPLKLRVLLNDLRFSPDSVRMAMTKGYAGRQRGDLDWSKSYYRTAGVHPGMKIFRVHRKSGRSLVLKVWAHTLVEGNGEWRHLS
jgi:hypothetical protein